MTAQSSPDESPAMPSQESPNPNPHPQAGGAADAHTAAEAQPASAAEQAAGTSAPDADAVATVVAELAALQAKHAEVADAYLRAKAEAENTRRRAEDEMAKARKFAVESFAESLLPVTDSLEAAIAMPEATAAQVLEGVHATLRQLQGALERHKVVPIAPPAGTKFDPHHHQAISMVPAEQEAGTVVAVLQKGYLIAERVLRPALVTVAASQ